MNKGPRKGKVFKENAVRDEKSFVHFGIHPITASLYGNKEEEIEEVKFVISESQTRPKPNEICENADYWGWFNFKENNFTMIYPQYFLLNMCFTYGIKASEDAQEGMAYRLEIVS